MSIYVALLAGCVLTMILGKFVLAELRKLKAGQEIRQDGPTWHNSKAGTPTMGGIAFILGSGIVTFACGWQQMVNGEFAHLYVYLFACASASSALWMITARYVSIKMRG